MSGKYCHWGGCCRRRPQTSLPFSPPSSLSRGHASSLPCRARPSVECCVLLPALLRRCCAPPLASPRFFPLLPFVLGLPFSTLLLTLLSLFLPMFSPFCSLLFPFCPFFPSPLLFSSPFSLFYPFPFCPFSTLFPSPFFPSSFSSVFYPFRFFSVPFFPSPLLFSFPFSALFALSTIFFLLFPFLFIFNIASPRPKCKRGTADCPSMRRPLPDVVSTARPLAPMAYLQRHCSQATEHTRTHTHRFSTSFLW